MKKLFLPIAVAVIVPIAAIAAVRFNETSTLGGSFMVANSTSSPTSSFVSSTGYCCQGDYCAQGAGCTRTLQQCLASCGSVWSSVGVSSSSSTSASPQVIADLSATIESNLTRVAANSNIVFTVKVKNVGSVATNGIVNLLRSDFTFISATGGNCSVPSADSTYVVCSTNTIAANATATLAITMRAAANFTCVNSNPYGRSTFAYVRSSDLFPQNDTTSIVNTLPVCP